MSRPVSEKTRYRQVRVDGRRVQRHRWVWEQANGRKLLPGEVVRHTCDIPRCDDPAHLLVGSQLDNEADKRERGRQATGERHGMHTHPESRPVGERAFGAKLTEENVREIRRRVRAGEVQRAVAAAFGVGPMEVSRIVRGLRWAHVKEEA